VRQTVQAAHRALDISSAQYRSGTAGYLTVITSQATAAQRRRDGGNPVDPPPDRQRAADRSVGRRMECVAVTRQTRCYGPTAATGGFQQVDEPVPDLHSPAGGHHHADGGYPAGRRGGYTQLPVSALPEVDYPIIQVTTFYPGASPDVMASAVTAPLERQFGQVPGLQQMTPPAPTGAR